jgi:zinc transporter 2
MKKLCTVFFISIIFIAVQTTGGILSGSIAIFTDTAHLASDLVGFAISMLSLTIAQRPASKSLSFGYHRAEVVGTLASIIFLWVLTIWLLVEATDRFVHPPEIEGFIMFVTAVLGLIFNLIQMKILHSGEGHYHLGGDEGHDHDHGEHEHKHDHKHEDNKHTHAAHEDEEHKHEEGHKHTHEAH